MKLNLFIKIIKKLIYQIRTEHIGAFSAYTAFFLILSFLPIVTLVYTFLNTVGLGSYENDILGADLAYMVDATITQSQGVSKLVLSFSTIISAWSAGRAFHSLGEGLDAMMGISKDKSYILLRLRSLVLSLIFALVLVILILFALFGKSLFMVFGIAIDEIGSALPEVLHMAFTLFALFIVMVFVYLFVPDWKSEAIDDNKRKYKTVPILICAFMCAVFICTYTYLFSRYVDKFIFSNRIYAGLNIITVIMLWIYFALYIVFLGFKLCLYMTKKKKLI